MVNRVKPQSPSFTITGLVTRHLSLVTFCSLFTERVFLLEQEGLNKGILQCLGGAIPPAAQAEDAFVGELDAVFAEADVSGGTELYAFATANAGGTGFPAFGHPGQSVALQTVHQSYQAHPAIIRQQHFIINQNL